MRIIKPHMESDELRLFRSLNSRMSLEVKDQQQYWNLEKGNEGELMFDSFIEKVANSGLILNDLLLEVNGTLFQIDSLHIFQETIYLFEIKNYEGDFYIENSLWYTRSGTEIKDPLSQVTRCESLFRRYLQQLRLPFNIKAHLIFVNPEFTLYQVPLNETIIFPSQLQQLIKNLHSVPSKISEKQLQLAKKLLTDHQTMSPYTRLPIYNYEELEKGILCRSCLSVDTHLCSGKITCHACDYVEDVDSSIMRNAEEFKLLFPDNKITTNGIRDWCRVVESRKTIKRVLTKNFLRVGHGKHTYYVSN